MKFKLSFCLWATLFLNGIDSKCSRLPSGKCWVSCLSEIFDVICTNVTSMEIQNDVRVFADSDQLFRLYVWNSPNIRRLSANIFQSVAKQVVTLDLQDVTNLQVFPEISMLTQLRRFSIWNSPKLCTLALELLPLTIWKLALSKVCISSLENDFNQLPQLPALEFFVLRNMTIRSWQPDFLSVFPNLTSLEISNSTFLVASGSDVYARVAKPLRSLKLVQNTMAVSLSTGERNDFLHRVASSTKSKDTPSIVHQIASLLSNLTHLDVFAYASNLTSDNSTDFDDDEEDLSTSTPGVDDDKYPTANNATKTVILTNVSIAELPTVSEQDKELFRQLRSAGEDVEQDASDEQMDFFTRLIDSTSVDTNATLDLSHNNYPLNNAFFKLLQRFHTVSTLSLRGNPVVADAPILSNMFEDFTLLTSLDLGQTNLVPVSGLLAGLAKLQTLYLDHNQLGDFEQVDMLDGFYGTSLRKLDMSYNRMQNLPGSQAFRDGVHFLDELNLRGNSLQFNNRTEQVLSWFANLKQVDLGANSFSRFHGDHLGQMVSLEVLNLSCNPLANMSQSNFAGLPDRIRDLDLSLCIHAPQPAPHIEMDAFTTLPANLTVLRLNSGAYKKWIFKAFTFASSSLKEIHLADNEISYVDEDTFHNLTFLEVLNLNSNRIQSISKGTFANLPNLKTLLLNNNRMISVGRTTFFGGSASDDSNQRQLQQLRLLDLSNNQITSLASGAFDELPNLQALFLGGNRVEVQGLFNRDAPALEYFGMQGYRGSCLQADFFQRLPKLKWLFADQYNPIRITPDKTLFARDEFLLSLIDECDYGKVVNDHDMYTGLSAFVSVTVHDTDDPHSAVQYPVLAAFIPLNYCPMDNYVGDLDSLLCVKPQPMVQSSFEADVE